MNSSIQPGQIWRVTKLPDQRYSSLKIGDKIIIKRYAPGVLYDVVTAQGAEQCCGSQFIINHCLLED